MPTEHFNFLFLKYKKLFGDGYFRLAILVGIFAVLLAGIATTIAKNYANQASGNPVGDLILDNLPTLPLFGFLVWGTLGIAFLIFAFALFNPEYLPAALKSVALLYFIRAGFITLTHIKVYPEKMIGAAADYRYLADLLYYGNDLFFSGHVALPFLALLIFWKHRWFRYFLIIAVLASGLGVLLAKSHYSIDVFAAPFITYSIFVISKCFFKKDFDYIGDS